MDSAKLETSIYKTEISKLSLLPSGGQSLKSQPNLSASFQGLLQEIASIADVIVLDLSNAGGQVAKEVETMKADLVVIGSKGHNAARTLLLETVRR